MKIYRHLKYLCLYIILISCGGCGVYSFTGVAISAETISIANFYNDADQGPPDLAQTFTNKLTDYFQSNTNFTLVPSSGELQLEGAVSGYRISPVAPSAATGDFEASAQLTRLTITVKATYINVTDDSFNFENRSFSFYTDFDNSQSLTAVEAQLIDEIYDQIVLDIFNASVANW